MPMQLTQITLPANSGHCIWINSCATAQLQHADICRGHVYRFMKLRLDRVLKLELGEATPEEALKSLAPVPDFKPLNQTVQNWTAPYPPYKPGWWQQFEPKH